MTPERLLVAAACSEVLTIVTQGSKAWVLGLKMQTSYCHTLKPHCTRTLQEWGRNSKSKKIRWGNVLFPFSTTLPRRHWYPEEDHEILIGSSWVWNVRISCYTCFTSLCPLLVKVWLLQWECISHHHCRVGIEYQKLFLYSLCVLRPFWFQFHLFSVLCVYFS